MARNIFIVNATQVVVSENHPEGVFSNMPDYPKKFDSRNYGATEDNPDGNTDLALRAAKSDYFARQSAIYVGSPTRVMASVTLEQANGRQLMHDSIGDFPVFEPPVEEEETEPEQGE